MSYFKKHSGWQYWLGGLVVGAVLPWLVNLSSLSVYHKVLWLLIGFNGLYAILVGWRVSRQQRDNWHVVIFPMVFAVATFLFKTNAHDYAYYMAIGYACISYFVVGFNAGFMVGQQPTRPRQSQTTEQPTVGSQG
ncbi:hypothetical protein [Furfurilactobacillus entadae]|uniref:hypothetical protein n=1 Tax=Furfurilactobacillus entadae TaxID=2922307 RepID=UPI0035F0B585